MKESMGNAFVFGAFIMFALLIILLLSASISYSRASKIKNRLVQYVEYYASKNTSSSYFFDGKDELTNQFLGEVDELLSSAGYRTKSGKELMNNGDSCAKMAADQNSKAYGMNYIPQSSGAGGSLYDYCIFAMPSARGYYYTVVTYMYFDIPIFNTTLKFPVSGSTRVVYNLADK